MYRIAFLLLFVPLLTTAQTINLPVWVIDSAMFEIRKGRQCESVVKAQANEIEKQGKELLAKDVVIELQKDESKTLIGLVGVEKEDRIIDAKEHKNEKQKLQRKVRKRNGIILVETIAIVVLLLL